MTTAILSLIVIALMLVALAAVKRYFEAREAFDILTETDREPIVDLGSADQLVADLEADEADHVARLAPAVMDPEAKAKRVEFVPDGFTCLGCHETDALPDSIWCAVCAERVANFPSEPIERGQR